MRHQPAQHMPCHWHPYTPEWCPACLAAAPSVPVSQACWCRPIAASYTPAALIAEKGPFRFVMLHKDACRARKTALYQMWSLPCFRDHQGNSLSIQRLASRSMNMACITRLAARNTHSQQCQL